MTVVTMESTMLIHAALICPKDTFSTDIWSMALDCALWIYNWIPGMQYGLSSTDIWSRSRSEPL